MRCRCRAPDFDITGRNTKSDICLLKKFSLCAVYMRKDMRLSRSSNYVYIIYITLYKYMCVYIYTHVSRVSLCIHAFGMTLIDARETQFAVTFLEADVDSCELDDVALRVRPNASLAHLAVLFRGPTPSFPSPFVFKFMLTMSEPRNLISSSTIASDATTLLAVVPDSANIHSSRHSFIDTDTSEIDSRGWYSYANSSRLSRDSPQSPLGLPKSAELSREPSNLREDRSRTRPTRSSSHSR